MATPSTPSMLNASHRSNIQPPPSGELLDLARLQTRAQSLAHDLRVSTRKPRWRGKRIHLRRLDRQTHLLAAVYREVAEDVHRGEPISPSAEWLLDNFHLITNEVRSVRNDLPPRYYRRLPRVAPFDRSSPTRVEILAAAIIAHSDGRLDAERLQGFIRAFQSVSPLTMGELWAWPSILKLTLVGHVSGLAERIRRVREDYARADLLVGNLDARPPRSGRSFAGDTSLPFVVRLLQHIREWGPGAAALRAELEEWLAAKDMTPEEAIRIEGQREAADQVSMANAITSLRLCATLDWSRFFEAVSHVEQILQRDPAGVYGQMDFLTRDRYRHAVEELSDSTAEGQVRVALECVECARRRAGSMRTERRLDHVGHYLIGAGRHEFDARHRGGRRWLRRARYAVHRHATLVYLLPIALLTGSLVAATLLYARTAGAPSQAMLWIALLILIPASELALAIVQRAFARLLTPRRLPRLDLDTGVPEPGRTMVIVPTLFGSLAAVDEMLAHLEVQALGNLDPRIHFAILSDFRDAQVRERPEDRAILQAARAGIEALNARHSHAKLDRFYLFHRERRWNPGEGLWMGWERKRGKIDEFNRFLRGATDTSFTDVVGDLSVLPSINYCITLDSDTRLPRDAAKSLIGIALHPLNRPKIDRQRRIVTEGYGILQPRVSVTLASAAGSVFARVYAGHTGVDPYTTAVSDTYQDLFGEGIYAGKGLYHVDTFRATLEGRIPDNTLLSHDLFESLHARAALATDVEVVDDYPATVLAHARRQQRWVRGDWQILLWLFPWVPTRRGLERNQLSLISRWKILDNLRRSLVAPSLVALLALGWTVLPGRSLAWTAAALIVLDSPQLLLLPRLPAVLWRRPWTVFVRRLWDDIKTTTAQVTLSLVLLVYHAWETVRAIVVTLIRLLVTQRRLLEWETAASVAARVRGLTGPGGLRTFEVEMASSPLVGLALLYALRNASPEVRLTALPFIAAWLLAPVIAYWLSQPVSVSQWQFTPDDERRLRGWARRTWHYFEVHLGPEGHWLPSDNLQEEYGPVVAYRTSPTNIGMALLATLAAHDFGYVTTSELVHRIDGTLGSIEGLEDYQGHLLNWYDTRTLAPLHPRYVSTVDSGNLVAALLTLASGLERLSARPQTDVQLIGGLADTADVLRSTAITMRRNQTHADDVLKSLESVARAVLRGCSSQAPQLEEEQLARWQETLNEVLTRHGSKDPQRSKEPDALSWARRLVERIEAYRSSDSAAASSALSVLADRSRLFAERMHFGFLYDRSRHLFSIGYRLADAEGPGRLDTSYYDLLASEARLASFLAIARGDVPQEHWFHLGRIAVSVDGVPTLLSWSATMFEYLMPVLLMRVFPNTLLDQTCRRAVSRQIQYGRRSGVPWGVSESAFAVVDRHNTYQYKAFGVPGLGLKRGLGDDLVVAPYATALALPFEPAEAMENLKRLEKLGVAGRFGFYDAIDYSSRRRSDEETPTRDEGIVVRTFMAHHQGMFLVSAANALFSDVMVERFHADSRVQATELLLQERVPRQAAAAPPRPAEASRAERVPQMPSLRRFRTPHTYYPHAQVLSNGSFATVVTNAGGGGSKWRDLAVTRWREDRTSDVAGQALYLRDVRSGDQWSATYQPTCREPDAYLVTFSAHKVAFRRTDFEIETQLDIAVAPEDDAEVRRLSVTNHSDRIREIEVTSYAEVVLGHQADDVAHPAFGKLFVETEYLPDSSALLCGRRPRTAHEPGAWLFHVLSVEGRTQAPTEWETSRVRFLGRGRSPTRPIALDRPLSGTTGAVLDPVVSLRQRVRLPPGGFARLSFATGAAADRNAARLLAQKYHDRAAAARAFAMAYTHSQMWLRHLGITSDVARQYDRLASRVFYMDDSLRADAETLAQNARGQSGLWPHGISGDLPIVLVRVVEEDDLTLARQVLQAQEYWRLQGLRADVVLLNEHPVSYLDEMQEQLVGLIERGPWSAWKDRPGGVYLLRGDGLEIADRRVLHAAARAILTGDRGELVHQLNRLSPPPMPPSPGPFAKTRLDASAQKQEVPDLLMANGTGGFGAGGREYVVVLNGEEETPAPWTNILASPEFGTLVTTSGAAFTWSENSRENRLTPFSNDAVSDPTGEAIFVRDETTGEVWGATPGPLPRSPQASWLIRHGAGFVRFERSGTELAQSLDVFVCVDDPVKISVLTLTNRSSNPRHLSVFGYAEWMLGPPLEGHRRHVVTMRDEETGSVVACNRFRDQWNERLAFLSTGEPPTSVTGDRMEFLGRHGDLSRPRALAQPSLSNRVGAGLDPCAALQLDVVLGPGESRQVTILLGEGRSLTHVRELIKRYTDPGSVASARQAVIDSWRRTLTAIQVWTPDDSLDLILNGWLLYQTVSSRLWARTGFYQPGGAFGFRDQLQDVMALAYGRPDLYRQHLLYCASRQFVEGDVQHWWDPISGRGIRSRCSDDLLWLPFAVAHYVRSTGDAGLLDEVVPFLEAPPLADAEIDSYALPARAAQSAAVYEHCVRAIMRGLTIGAHGLPLIGSGDWNDGFNEVGSEGRGESVWLGWFLYHVLTEFGQLADARGDDGVAERFRAEARRLAGALELAWDGEWYRRAYFDDGRPLGSAQNDECRIDSVAQSWAVLSKAAPAYRAERAMDAARSHLIRREAQVVLLLTPPFDRSELNPGYIKGYIPGVRENGGQYTHAALWMVMALARLGYGDEAVELFHMINPVNRTRDAAGVQRYVVEPYVVAGDVYAHPDHSGRGGWTWYTGSAGWMYRVGIESILGLKQLGKKLAVAPCIPAVWPGFKLRWQFGASSYEVEVDNAAHVSSGVADADIDGRTVSAEAIPLVDDGRPHRVRIVMGPARSVNSESSDSRSQTVR